MQTNFVVNNSQNLALVVWISKEKSTGRRITCWLKFSATLFFIDDICIFFFCQQKSVEVHWYVLLNLFAKCRWKFPATFMYQFVNIDDIMLSPAERRRNVPLISYICLEHVDGNFQRHFFRNLLEDTDDICFCIQNVSETFYWYFKSFCKMSMEISIDIFLSIKDIDDILLCLAKRRWKISSILCIYFQNVDGNFPSTFCFHQ